MTDTNPSQKTDSISKSGSFLQLHVVGELEKKRWSTHLEFPVQAAPFIADPIKHPIHKISKITGKKIFFPENIVKAIFECQNKSELSETSIDVISESSSSDKKLNFLLAIECKKLDPNYSEWVFFQEKEKARMHLIVKDLTSKGFISLFKIPGTTQLSNELHVDLAEFDWDPFKQKLANSSIAISNEKIDKNTYITKKSLVDNAARQIIEGSYGYVINDIQHDILDSESYLNRIYVPIIVTTAKLKICKINSVDIDPVTGFATKEPDYEDIDSIIYECAPPKSVRFPHPEFTKLRIDHRKALLKWHVLIFSPKGFITFLNDLNNTELVS